MFTVKGKKSLFLCFYEVGGGFGGGNGRKNKDVHSGKKGVDGWRCLIF